MPRHRFLRFLILFALALPCLAQVVHVANYSGSAFEGWKRATIDVAAPHAAGQLADGTRFVLGRRLGTDARVVDLRLRLEPGEVRTIDLAKSDPRTFELRALPADPLAFFGAPTIAGTPLQVVGLQPDGAAWLAHLRSRTGRMLCTDLWLWWYPDQPGWACGEAVVTASNPAVPDLTATVPPNFRLAFGTADVLVPGAQGVGPCLLPAGTILGDGQARSFPLVLVWRQHLRAPVEWSSAGAAAALGIAANGIAKLWPDGPPALPAGDSPLAWTIAHWADAIESLHRWAPPRGLGVNARSGDTGSQEDQVFVGGECVGTAGLGAEAVRYLTALAQSRRPCHHLEVDGAQLRLAEHPQLVVWDGRAHWHAGVSPDRLGKPRSLTELDTAGWWGPDVEHWLINTLSIAARMTGSPALQWQLEAQARIYLLQWTVDPRLSTSQAYAARAVGWEGIAVVHLWLCLEDRALAAAVRDRWLARLDAILLPRLGSMPLDIWDVRKDDPRLGSGEWWIPWQQSVGVYGLDLAGRTFGRADARALARRGAARVVVSAWRQSNGRWVGLPQMAVDGRGEPDESFNLYGMPLAPAVLLRGAPNERARAIYGQLLQDAGGGGRWIAPGVR